MEKEYKIDIEKIMEEIRDEIAEKGYTDDLLSFEDTVISTKFNITSDYYHLSKINEDAIYLNSGAWILNYYAAIEGNVFVKFIKRGVRKLNLFLLLPIFKQQSQVNAAIVRMLNIINDFIGDYECKEQNTEGLIALLKIKNEKEYKTLIENNQELSKRNKTLISELQKAKDENTEILRELDIIQKRLTVLELDNKIIEKKFIEGAIN